MKRIFACLVAQIVMIAVSASVLTQFDLNHYDGWEYNRTGEKYELNQYNISHLYIRLYQSFALTSPEVMCSEVDSVKMTMVYHTQNYSKNKLPLRMVVTNQSGTVVADTLIAVLDRVMEQEVKACIAVPAGTQKLAFAFSAPRADVDSNGAVRSVVIESMSSHVAGDVTGDGVVDVSDSNSVVNEILTSSVGLVADVNGDGVVDVSDSNMITNIILGTDNR